MSLQAFVYTMDYSIRKNHRVHFDNYTHGGYYFVTICTHDKACIFSRILPGNTADAIRIIPSKYGIAAMEAIQLTAQQFNEVRIPEYIVMPNHIHLIVAIRESDNTPSLATVIRFLKIRTTQKIHGFDPERIIWQRNYYDHVIRDEADYITKANYIQTNPIRWIEKQQS